MTDNNILRGYQPVWAENIFYGFIDRLERLSDVLHMSIAGINYIQKRHGLLKELLSIDGEIKEATSKDKLAKAKREEELAKKEVETDFPILHEQSVIAMWSMLESLVYLLAAKCLANELAIWKTDSISKLQVRIGDYESLDHFEKCMWIVGLLDQSTSAPNKSGITRFEKLLQVFNLDGSFNDEHNKALYELHHIRNVLIHRGGLVDNKLLKACPWIKLKPGQQLLISHSMWIKYQKAVGKYCIELAKRTNRKFGTK